MLEKDNWLIEHCHTSEYKNGLVVGMRVEELIYQQ